MFFLKPSTYPPQIPDRRRCGEIAHDRGASPRRLAEYDARCRTRQGVAASGYPAERRHHAVRHTEAAVSALYILMVKSY